MPPKVKYYLEERNQAFLNSLFYKILRVNLVVKRDLCLWRMCGLIFQFLLLFFDHVPENIFAIRTIHVHCEDIPCHAEGIQPAYHRI